MSKRFPSLLIVTYQLRRVLSNGMPEADYNDRLADLDHHLVTCFDPDLGRAVLVETFNGRRNYCYSYLCADVDAEKFERETASRFPAEPLTWEVRDDPDWQFIKGYAREFGF